MAKGIFDDGILEFTCANCGKEHPKTIGWIKANDHFTCECGARTDIERDQALEAFGRVDQAMERLMDAFGKFGKK